MSESDETIQKVLEVRKVNVDYEEQQAAAPLDIPVDLHNFTKFPVVDPPGTHKPVGSDTRGEIQLGSSPELPDYSGPFKADLRFSDFSNQALVDMIAMSDEYYRVCVQAWADETAKRYGPELMREIQAEAWSTIVLPQLAAMLTEWMPISAERAEALTAEVSADVAARQADGGVVTINPFRAEPGYVELPKDQLVKLALGSHEFLLTAIEGWAGDIVIRYGLDVMFDFQWELWSEKVLPAVRALKARWMKIGDGTVEAFIKDVQIDASSFPGKAFDLTFEMPEPDVGIMTYNKCIQVNQWESLGRPDIAEKSAHVTCPASIIETAKMYNPNIKVEILAIPPRVSTEHVCCKWRLSMRDASDPEYVEPTATP
ncbi:hypothetical protein [Mycobacterium sp.]|uniref:hypothetical protein n=1 Tax=Mycobacterium sp. TaxID=1785 RepID=UPI002C6F8D94|nr:hypothetical protein [Mycobacterium sp.]HTQ21320.1 hypothetical protein [Mycobacterium sp.]